MVKFLLVDKLSIIVCFSYLKIHFYKNQNTFEKGTGCRCGF
jgi:hypothetical protein